MLKKIMKLVLIYPFKITNNIFTFLYYKLCKKSNFEKIKIKEGKKKILVLSPHVDDESIGLGGTLIKHSINNDKITIVYITDGRNSNTNLTSDELISLRKKEALEIKKKLNVENIIFLNREDGKVESNELVDDIYKILLQIEPDIIYSNFLIDGHTDHVETTKSLIKAGLMWNKNFNNVFLYEINNPIKPKLLNSISVLNYEQYLKKVDLLNTFKSQYAMGFEAFLLLNRMKKHIAKQGKACEVFVKVDFNTLEKINKFLYEIDFNPYRFKQLSSEFNLIQSFLKSIGYKNYLSNEIYKIIKEDKNERDK